MSRQSQAEVKLIIILSGKRKCGKDYLAEEIQRRIGSNECSILRLSGPLKTKYAQEHGLDINRLLDSSDYKENYRSDMILWGEQKRSTDYGYFCRLIASGPGSEKPLWIVSDARRRSDLTYFNENYDSKRLFTVRVVADEAVRQSRGWIYTPGVDDAESECDLDNGTFDITINNNGDVSSFEQQIGCLLTVIDSRMNAV